MGFKRENEHSLEIFPGQVQAEQILGQIKETARTEENPVRSTKIRIINRAEASVNLEVPPITDRHFAVPAKFKEISLYGHGYDNERMMIFGIQEPTIRFGSVINLSECLPFKCTCLTNVMFRLEDFNHLVFMLY